MITWKKHNCFEQDFESMNSKLQLFHGKRNELTNWHKSICKVSALTSTRPIHSSGNMYVSTPLRKYIYYPAFLEDALIVRKASTEQHLNILTQPYSSWRQTLFGPDMHWGRRGQRVSNLKSGLEASRLRVLYILTGHIVYAINIDHDKKFSIKEGGKKGKMVTS